jgi:DNA-directed RNA polymerase specialized sigma24 family protein
VGVDTLPRVANPSIPRDLIRRVENENFPLLSLSALRELREALDEIEAEAIVRAHEMGASSTDIGDAMGLTRQAAHYRLRHALDRRAAEPPTAEDETIVIPEPEDTPRT